MTFPTTRLTLLEQLRTKSMGHRWQQSWGEFFNLYHEVIKTCVRSAFYRKGWTSLSPDDQNDVTMEVFQAIYHDKKTGSVIELDFSKGKFRQLIQIICSHKVSDFIRRQQKLKNNLNLDAVAVNPALNQDPNLLDRQHQESENREFLKAQVATIMSSLYGEISPQSYQIFERVKLLGEDPAEVARVLGIKRGVVDNSLYKTKKKLEALIQKSAISREFLPDTATSPSTTVEALVADDSLNDFKTLYREHEVAQNSPEHQALSMRFEQTIKEEFTSRTTRTDDSNA